MPNILASPTVMSTTMHGQSYEVRSAWCSRPSGLHSSACRCMRFVHCTLGITCWEHHMTIHAGLCSPPVLRQNHSSLWLQNKIENMEIIIIYITNISFKYSVLNYKRASWQLKIYDKTTFKYTNISWKHPSCIQQNYANIPLGSTSREILIASDVARSWFAGEIARIIQLGCKSKSKCQFHFGLSLINPQAWYHQQQDNHLSWCTKAKSIYTVNKNGNAYRTKTNQHEYLSAPRWSYKKWKRTWN